MRTTSLACALALAAVLSHPVTAQPSADGIQFSTLATAADDSTATTGSPATAHGAVSAAVFTAPPVMTSTTAVRLPDGRIEHHCEQRATDIGGPSIHTVSPSLREHRK